MLSPVQIWQKAPSQSTEHAMYASLKQLRDTSAILRKEQAIKLWRDNFMENTQFVSPLKWACVYAEIAPYLEYKIEYKDGRRIRQHMMVRYHMDDDSEKNIWLRNAMYASHKPLWYKEAWVPEYLRSLGFNNPLAQALVMTRVPEKEQVDLWTSIFYDQEHMAAYKNLGDLGLDGAHSLKDFMKLYAEISGNPIVLETDGLFSTDIAPSC